MALVRARVEIDPEFMASDCVMDPAVQWNGWACPFFTKEQGMDLVHQTNRAELAGYHAWYEEDGDYFVFTSDDDTEPERFGPVVTGEGKGLYPIGAWCWTWYAMWVEDHVEENGRWLGVVQPRA